MCGAVGGGGGRGGGESMRCRQEKGGVGVWVRRQTQFGVVVVVERISIIYKLLYLSGRW